MFYQKFLIATSIMLLALPYTVAGSSPSSSFPIEDTLTFSTVVAEKGFIISRKDTVSLNGSLGADEALAKIPGLLVNDNGGLSGLKTISLRGLGSAHTTIYIDGVQVSNLMSGQSDLSIFSHGHFSNAIVDYAQNSIELTSTMPSFENNRTFSAKASFIGGSFGTYMPALSADYRISDKVTAGANISGTLYKGYRPHSQISQVNGCVDFKGIITEGVWKAKAYIHASDRNCPGSTTYPYLSAQKDINGFAQGSMIKKFSDLYTLNTTAKYSHDRIWYKDDFSESRYNQNVFQINSSHLFKVARWCKLSASVSGNWNGLKSDNYIKSDTSGKLLTISRTGLISAASASFSLERLKAEVNVGYIGAYDRGNGIRNNRHSFSPAASIRFTTFEGLDIVAFGRKDCHIPTFNDLYYSFQGNKDLKAEEAWITDVGVDWRKKISHQWTLIAKADGFFNFLTDKITWAPSPEDKYMWLPYNIGKVRSTGTDISIGGSYAGKDIRADLSVRYTYQDAKDRTEGSLTYDSQIAYVPKHTVLVCGDIHYKGWGLDITWNFKDGRLDSTGPMPQWNALDMNFHKTLKIKDICLLSFKLMGRNITNQQYEISSGYPMPGWALYGGLEILF